MSTKTWNGVPLDQINWFPTIDKSKCTKCFECINFCAHGVYTKNEQNEPVVSEQYNCVVGCTGCQKICPVGAISFPPREYLNSFSNQNKARLSGCSCGGKC